jgi:hypothetical protein
MVMQRDESRCMIIYAPSLHKNGLENQIKLHFLIHIFKSCVQFYAHKLTLCEITCYFS